jgi:hypothetical protein
MTSLAAAKVEVAKSGRSGCIAIGGEFIFMHACGFSVENATKEIDAWW